MMFFQEGVGASQRDRRGDESGTLVRRIERAHRIHDPGPLTPPCPPNSSSSSRSSFSGGATVWAKVNASASPSSGDAWPRYCMSALSSIWEILPELEQRCESLNCQARATMYASEMGESYQLRQGQHAGLYGTA